jgi:hypothetical protein
MDWPFRLAALAVAAVIVGLVVRNHRLHCKLQDERQAHQKTADHRDQVAHDLKAAVDRADRLNDINQHLAMQGARFQGEVAGLRVAAQDTNREAFDRIQAATAEMEQTRLAMRVLMHMIEKWAPPDVRRRVQARTRELTRS